MAYDVRINYNGGNIDLFYSPYFLINKSDFLRIKVKGSGTAKFFEDYQEAEEEAQIYLIKNAMDKRKPNCNLEKITGIMQNIICNPSNEHFELEIILTGTAFFKKIKISKIKNL